VDILPPDEPYGGATLGAWGARWLQWIYSFPEDIHPGFDTTGERCGYGQHGPVFFLPPALGEGPQFSYDCVVPEGTAIHVIYRGIFCSSLDAPPFFGANEQELQACLDEQFVFLPAGIEVAVNGQPVTDPENYWARSPMFTLNVPEGLPDGFLPRGPGVALAMADSIGFIIAPPPPGEYLISVTDPDPAYAYTVNVTVEAPQIVEPTGTEAPSASEAAVVTAPPPTT
jgi:hypothetical protein